MSLQELCPPVPKFFKDLAPKVRQFVPNVETQLMKLGRLCFKPTNLEPGVQGMRKF